MLPGNDLLTSSPQRVPCLRQIGRIWAGLGNSGCSWIVGIAIFMASNGNLGAIYAGRFIAGLGVGQTPVDRARLHRRDHPGQASEAPVLAFFTGLIYLGIVLAYFTNYGCQVNLGDVRTARWLVPTSLHIIFAGLILILTLAQPNPRDIWS